MLFCSFCDEQTEAQEVSTLVQWPLQMEQLTQTLILTIVTVIIVVFNIWKNRTLKNSMVSPNLFQTSVMP